MTDSDRRRKLGALFAGATDQGSLAAFNFLVVVAAARSLATADFAGFVLVFAGYAFSYALSMALWSGPLLVFGVGKFKDRFSDYVRSVVWLNVSVSGPTVLIVVAVVARLSPDVHPATILAATGAGVVRNSYDVLRKARYAEGAVGVAAISGLVLLISFASAAWWLPTRIEFTTATFFLLYGGSHLPAIVSIAKGRWLIPFSGSSSSIWREVLRIHWGYGRWIAGGSIAYWIATQGYLMAIAVFVSSLDLAAIRAAQNLAGLINIAHVVFDNLFTPTGAKVVAKGRDLLRRFTLRQGLRLLPVYAVGVATVAVGGYHAFDILYGAEYAAYAGLVWPFVAYQVCLGLARPGLLGLRATEATSLIFRAHTGSAVAVMAIGTLLAATAGAWGAASGYVIAGFVFTSVITWGYYSQVGARKTGK